MGCAAVLLSSIEGYAVTQVKIDGVLHEFTTIPGVYEDVTDIILNIKGLLVRLEDNGPVTLKIDVSRRVRSRPPTSSARPDAEILNADHVVATLTDKIDFRVEMEARKGRGYVTAEENEKEEKEIGVIPMDSNFSP
jgi:DNA-directed RNA polymerase subunit alpha